MRKLVEGVGLNDADYQVIPKDPEDHCPYYRAWHHMIKRAYNKKLHENHPTYKGCTVCEEWLVFSKFKKWMESQNWEGLQLDKDVMYPNNKVYSPKTCVFIPRTINTFLTTRGNARGKYLLGCYFHKGKYVSRISIAGVPTNLGSFDTEGEAHSAWKDEKRHQFNLLIKDPSNSYIAKGLIKHRDILCPAD